MNHVRNPLSGDTGGSGDGQRVDPDEAVVDGGLLRWTTLQSLLQTHEGWGFEPGTRSGDE